MTQLPDKDRRLLHLRIELDMGCKEIALIMGQTSPDAARVAIQRSLLKLARCMGQDAGNSEPPNRALTRRPGANTERAPDGS
jgi:DNA-directed RNA polymerase specialized sigma24 family protein